MKIICNSIQGHEVLGLTIAISRLYLLEERSCIPPPVSQKLVGSMPAYTEAVRKIF